MRDQEFSNMIVRLKNRKGVSYRQLGELLSIPGSTLSNWANGYNVPDSFKKAAIAEKIANMF